MLSRILVTTLADSGPGSLRQAILEANATPTRDTISFAEGLSGTIALLSPLPSITAPLSILGPGADEVTVSGQNAVQILVVGSCVDLILSGLTLQAGNAGEGGAILNRGRLQLKHVVFAQNVATFRGGAIFNNSGILILRDCLFTLNSTTGDGGALANRNGHVVIERSTFTENQGQSGGAIRDFAGLLSLSHCTFTANEAEFGGAIFAASDRIAIRQSAFRANNARLDGGGISSSGKLEVTACEFVQNTAPQGNGGAIIMADGALTIERSRFQANSAGLQGGALFNLFSTITIRSSTLQANAAGGDGGAISTFALESVTLIDSDVTENQASGGGGGLFSDSALRLINTNLSANLAGDGGGLLNFSGLVQAPGSAIFGNTAETGGGLRTNGGFTRLVNVTLAQNAAQTLGGAIFSTDGLTALSFVTVNENRVEAAAGGGVEQSGTANVFVQNSLFANTTNAAGDGRPNCAGTLFSFGGNFSTDASCPGFMVVSVDSLRLQPLKVNPPGRTPTFALGKGSRAIDAAVSCADLALEPVRTDQRGVKRPQGKACDSGAYERRRGIHHGEG